MNIQFIEIVNGEHIDRTSELEEAEYERREAKRKQETRVEAFWRSPLGVNARLGAVLALHDTQKCECGHKVGWGDIAWNNACTEAGTGYSIVEIQCLSCQKEIAHIDSWRSPIEDKDDLLCVMEEDWGGYI